MSKSGRRQNHDWASEDFEDEEVSDDFESIPEDFEDSNFEELGILAEYEEDLQQPQYIIEEDLPGLALDLKLDEFIANFEASIERNEIGKQLQNFSRSRLTHWLPWAATKEWTTESLLLFLEVRELWDATPEWWEGAYRSDSQWIASSSYGNLRLDGLYFLVQCRLEYSADDVIDEQWFEDWVDYSLWQHGFLSFISFAIFRARLNGNEKWTDHIDVREDTSGWLEDPFGEEQDNSVCWYEWIANQKWYQMARGNLAIWTERNERYWD